MHMTLEMRTASPWSSQDGKLEAPNIHLYVLEIEFKNTEMKLLIREGEC